SMDEWTHAESSQRTRPHRLDYWLTFKHKTDRIGEAERRLTVKVAGDRIAQYADSYVKVPQEWTRARDVERKGLRNRFRRVAGMIAKFAVALFLLYQFFTLLGQRLLTRADWKALGIGAVVLGAVPALLGLINRLPTIGRAYYDATETSYGVYLGLRFARWPLEILSTTLLTFVILLVALLVFKSWNPNRSGYPHWRSWLAPLRPKNWGSAVNVQGGFLAIFGVLFLSGFGGIALWAKARILPRAFNPQTDPTRFNLDQLSEILRFANDIPYALRMALITVVVLLALRRFLHRDVVIAVFLAVAVLLTQNLGSTSGAELAFEIVVKAVGVLLLYTLFARVFAWNLAAYILFWYLLATRANLWDAHRYLVGHDAAFQAA
ncbi:MAG: hypothetical protein KDA71_17245, partial [Planctomycetales bacterium]|nr:hypothetical protein [Planctomycetales bacterium]